MNWTYSPSPPVMVKSWSKHWIITLLFKASFQFFLCNENVLAANNIIWILAWIINTCILHHFRAVISNQQCPTYLFLMSRVKQRQYFKLYLSQILRFFFLNLFKKRIIEQCLLFCPSSLLSTYVFVKLHFSGGHFVKIQILDNFRESSILLFNAWSWSWLQKL